ncbi:MAG: ASCH domain-containing protein [Bdellovibrionales bacterium]|nr:ASCH domain-containing protein [Bdellovibrionales bacterium]
MSKIITEMRALSIIQPWAELIVSGKKNVENRSWDSKHRGFVAIHASKAKTLFRFEDCKEVYNINVDPDSVAYGCVIGFAEVVDVISEDQVTNKTKKWFTGDYGLVVKNMIKLSNPVPVKGALGYWKLKGQTLSKCLVQLSAKQRLMIANNLLSPRP